MFLLDFFMILFICVGGRFMVASENVYGALAHKGEEGTRVWFKSVKV